MRLVFDIETNGLLDELTKVHCITAKDPDTGKAYDWRPHEVEDALDVLMAADQLIGHNIIRFDIPALKKVYPHFEYPESKVRDTLVLSRLIWSDLSDRDFARRKKGKEHPGKYIGSHALGAWGYRLGVLKDEYNGGWETWSEDMHSYAIQDAEVTERLWKLIEDKEYSQEAIDLEHRVAWIMARCTDHGFAFDTEAANALAGQLIARRAELEAELQDAFCPWYKVVGEEVPKRTVNYRARPATPGTWKGAPYTELVWKVFNPGSRQHIADRLQAVYGWRPKDFTPKGEPKVDETILGKLDYPEAKKLTQYLTVQKRLGQLAEGKQSWIGRAQNGRIHADYITNGAVTGRATHKNPNIAQVPAGRAFLGKECRSLFRASPGRVLVGVDLSGIELRCLAHFMAKYDGGAYGRELLEGDIHTANQHAAGLPTRDQAKTFIYALLYGAGDAKIGQIVGKSAKAGRLLKNRMFAQVPALGQLVQQVQKAAGRGYLVGLDGRHLHIRSPHAALNTLLQSAGALIAKRWLVEFEDALIREFIHNRVHLTAWVHDEIQIECLPADAERVKQLAIDAAQRAGEHFRFRIPVAAEGNIGQTWADTH